MGNGRAITHSRNFKESQSEAEHNYQQRETDRRIAQAIVKETVRLHLPAPLLIPRTVETDVKVYGCTFPQRVQVLVNAWDIGHDPSVCPASFSLRGSWTWTLMSEVGTLS
ncbi:hypothetical protein Vadar_024031 [Vaccinium darrowii]|uniref:Uncharacterized protein n=1 Tax=Vaccinium darrowii TaxID=229202 RepID=A0ACB7YFM8_9ERIC|nr:hypothetical protein Vadar_024031 [Vaccinium darrowii]